MNRINLVILWHMHQPQYRDPSTGRYVLPWTRLHALKDYWGMVHVLREFPCVHATFNVVPSLGTQLEEYASGRFDEPWFNIAFTPAEELDRDAKNVILERAFQLNHEQMISRWPRFVELFHATRSGPGHLSMDALSLRDWRDLQVLSQVAWMDEHWLQTDETLQRLASKGAEFSEQDKAELREKQLQVLADVLPEYRRAAESGQIEISTTPFYHPILPLVCDSDAGVQSNSWLTAIEPAFRHPEDAREQLLRARAWHKRVFGGEPVGLWPSEGSVSDQALEIAAELGFRWFATDEGVLGRTLGVGFGRDGQGIPENADKMYAPLRVRRGSREITGFFRDHYLSDLVGFVYSRMDAGAAAEDLHLRIRAIGERVHSGRPLTVSVILDGENAWEYFPRSGREFLRQFYRRIQEDADIQPMTVSEALTAANAAEGGSGIATVESIVPGSWINANFDIWIGNSEDQDAWRLLRDARDAYTRVAGGIPSVTGDGDGLTRGSDGVDERAAYEALLAAEGSDWCWWYGPEHSSANDAEFDAFYRKLLTEVYVRLGLVAPDALAEPIKRRPERALIVQPEAYLRVAVDGRASSYFEWIGAGLYSPVLRSSSMHGRVYLLGDLHYGFDEENFYLRVDPITAAEELKDGEFRIVLRAGCELRVHVPIVDGKSATAVVEHNDMCPLGTEKDVKAAFGQFLELSVARALVDVTGRSSFSLSVSFWQGGLPMDVVPAEGFLDVRLGVESFAWGK